MHMKRNTNIQKGIQRDRGREERVLHSPKLLFVKISVNNVLNNEKNVFLIQNLAILKVCRIESKFIGIKENKYNVKTG